MPCLPPEHAQCRAYAPTRLLHSPWRCWRRRRGVWDWDTTLPGHRSRLVSRRRLHHHATISFPNESISSSLPEVGDAIMTTMCEREQNKVLLKLSRLQTVTLGWGTRISCGITIPSSQGMQKHKSLQSAMREVYCDLRTLTATWSWVGLVPLAFVRRK